MFEGKSHSRMAEKSRFDELVEDEKMRVLDYDPKDRAAYVRRHVNLILDAKKRRVEQSVLQERYSEFAGKYPMLFKMLFAPDVDMKQIDYMIRMLETIGNSGRTLHDASTAVGTQLADRYIHGVLDTRKKGGA
jgi:hypothetical protein